MSKFWFVFWRVLGFVWLLPATILVWLFYIFPMWIIFKDLVFMGWADLFVAEFVLAKKDLEPWFAKLWKDWGGYGGPCVILRRQYPNAPWVAERTRKHELRHCHQQFLFGVFHYPLYGLMSVFIWLFLKALHAYLDNPFERDARRAAGQQVDIPREQWMHGRGDRWPWW